MSGGGGNSIASSCTSSTSSGKGQTTPAARARLKYPLTAPWLSPRLLAIARLRQLARIPQPQNFSDLAHRQSLGWHPIPRFWAKGQAYPRLRTAGDADRYTLTSA